VHSATITFGRGQWLTKLWRPYVGLRRLQHVECDIIHYTQRITYHISPTEGCSTGSSTHHGVHVKDESLVWDIDNVRRNLKENDCMIPNDDAVVSWAGLREESKGQVRMI